MNDIPKSPVMQFVWIRRSSGHDDIFQNLIKIALQVVAEAAATTYPDRAAIDNDGIFPP